MDWVAYWECRSCCSSPLLPKVVNLFDGVATQNALPILILISLLILMLADYDVVDHFDVLIHLESLLILISLFIISPWQCDQMVTLYIQPLSIYNNEHLANTIKIGQSRFKILPNMKETLENYQIFWHARQCGDISQNLVALFFAFLNSVFFQASPKYLWPKTGSDRGFPRLAWPTTPWTTSGIWSPSAST